MQLTQRRNSLWLGLLLLLAGGVAILLVRILGDWTGQSAEGVPAIGPEASSGARPEREPLEARPGEPDPPPAVRQEAEGSPAPRLLCLSSAERRPVAGIRLLEAGESVAGPTAADGVLVVEGEHRGLLIAWGEGWLPVEMRGTALPELVLLEPADASLEIRLLNSEAGHRVVRTLLQSHSRSIARSGPWTPILERRAADRYGAEGIPPGAYDVYFWTILDEGEPRSYSLRAVSVPPGERAVVDLDLSAPDPVGDDD